MNELQPKLARLSSRGRQIIVEHSGHAIQSEAPEAVIETIREVVVKLVPCDEAAVDMSPIDEPSNGSNEPVG